MLPAPLLATLIFFLPKMRFLDSGVTMVEGVGYEWVKKCYECTSGPNDGCDDPARLSKWATDCPRGTQGCLKMKAPGSPLTRSCGNPPDSPVPIKDGCVNKPGVGIICSCSSGSLCNHTVAFRRSCSASTLYLLLASTFWLIHRHLHPA
ncbi:hypothetical protein RvY_14159 [Ramazzottius varieornatus]|uniref:Protein quiver n=1 Tax=Ramazzottius varieornatus TaxID=947166 RepID=A0A1D1VYU3_RAMVA|nr:hypothetical protein RvY_14159 [Ramazzottius varieornatus]